MNINQTIQWSYEESKRIIQEAQENNQLVLFVGAGASIDSGMPSWNKAVDKIKKRLGYEEKDDQLLPANPLKIPQYYFNQRGKNEYTNLMRKIFKYGETLPTTKLHQKLMKFNAPTIITTNYDYLIEQAAEENGEAIQVISSDIDLAYKNLGKELIKIHGDFEHDNFVLKEDDYLNYSANFKLIENYVKSIIGTKVVLFIGYSFNDPDIKQIFAWSKDILKDDMRRAYLINVDSEYDRDLEEDYKKFGINVIFAKSWINSRESDGPSEVINKTLDKLLDKKLPALNSVYESLKGFKNFNYVYGKYINQAFSKVGIVLNEKNILVARDNVKTETSKNVIEALNNEDTEVVNKIRNILSKSRVEGYENIDEVKKVDKKEEVPEWIKAVKNFDFEKLRSIRGQNNISMNENNPKQYLIQAAISYYLGEYVTSYEYLQQASTYLYKKHNYAYYLIAEMNRKWVGQFILDNYLDSELVRSKIKEEITNIDFKRTLNSLPDLENNNEFLRELTNFKVSYGLLQDVYDKGLKVKDESNNVYFGYVVPNYQQLRNNMKDFFQYGLENYLLLDNLIENINVYKLYIQNMLISVAALDRKDTLFAGRLQGQNLHLESFTEFELYIILNFFVSAKEVNEVFDNTIGLVKISDSGLKYLKTIIKNFNELKDVNTNKYIENIYWKLIALCGHIQLDPDVVTELLKSFEPKICTYNMTFYHDYMIKVLNSALRQNFIVDKHKEALNNLLEAVLKKALLQKSDKAYIYFPLVNLITMSLKELKCKYANPEIVKQLKKKHYDLILAIIYPLCKSQTKAALKRYFEDRLLKKSQISNYQDYAQLYVTVVEDKIIEPNEKAEQVVIDYLNSEDKKAEEVTQMPNYIEDILSDLSILYLDKKVTNNGEIKRVINTYGTMEQKWTTELEKFDYDNFKINWLEHYNNDFLTVMSVNLKVKEKIRKKFKEEYQKGNISKSLLDIYFDYFAD